MSCRSAEFSSCSRNSSVSYQGTSLAAVRAGGTAMRRLIMSAIVATAALVLAPAQARAEGYVSPWVAANAGSGFDNGRAGFGTQAGRAGRGNTRRQSDFRFSPDFL